MGREFLNRRSFEGIELPLGPDWGGPLFFAHSLSAASIRAG